MSSSEPFDAHQTLDAWRRHGADRLDPIRFGFIEALTRRATGYSGDARRVLDDKLSKLLIAYARDLEAAQSVAAQADHAASKSEPVRSPLAELIDDLTKRATADNGTHGANEAAPARAAYPELASLDYFRDVWSRLSTKRQLKQSQERVPDNAGPLNSSLLVHRTLSLMRELSPEYLHQFLSYVDALSWVERTTFGDMLADRDASRAGGGKKHSRGTAR